MASTPSASALSAVLRCRGNILSRNPPTKRPAAAAYSLGLTGASPAERVRPDRASAWEDFLQGHRVRLGTTLTVAYDKDGNALRAGYPRGMTALCDPKLAQSAGGAHGVQSALVRQLTSNLHGINKSSRRIRQIVKATHTWEVFECPAGVLKVTVKAPRLLQRQDEVWFRFSCWFWRLAELWRSRRSRRSTNHDLQANRDTQSPAESRDGSGSGPLVPEDRPD